MDATRDTAPTHKGFSVGERHNGQLSNSPRGYKRQLTRPSINFSAGGSLTGRQQTQQDISPAVDVTVNSSPSHLKVFPAADVTVDSSPSHPEVSPAADVTVNSSPTHPKVSPAVDVPWMTEFLRQTFAAQVDPLFLLLKHRHTGPLHTYTHRHRHRQTHAHTHARTHSLVHIFRYTRAHTHAHTQTH